MQVMDGPTPSPPSAATKDKGVTVPIMVLSADGQEKTRHAVLAMAPPAWSPSPLEPGDACARGEAQAAA